MWFELPTKMKIKPTFSWQDEFPVPDEYPVAVTDFTPVLKWRRKPSVASVSSSLPDLLGNSTSSLSAVDPPFQPSEPLQGEQKANTLHEGGDISFAENHIKALKLYRVREEMGRVNVYAVADGVLFCSTCLNFKRLSVGNITPAIEC